MKLIVLGSINVDSIYQVDRFPQPGETISVKNKQTAPGGKGANQAVAAVRSGANVRFVGAVGNDSDGQRMVEILQKEGIDTENIQVDDQNGTGSAVITLDASGQNDIMVYGGANQAMKEADWDKVLCNGDFIVAQLETPQEVTLAAFKQAKESGLVTVLNPAPATKLLPDLLAYTDIIIPNETEAEKLTGILADNEDNFAKISATFAKEGVATTIITLGEAGVYYSTSREKGSVSAFKVKAVDTTAAGDTFIGALISQLDPSLANIKTAITYAQKASSIAVQKMGAMPSIPNGEEVNRVFR